MLKLDRNWTRRATIGGAAASVGAGLSGIGWETRASEPPPEVTRISFLHDQEIPALCWAPQYIAIELLKQEGFTEVVLGKWLHGQNESQMLASGAVDFAPAVSTDLASAIDRGLDVKVLGGLHPGCIEMYAQKRIRRLKDLKGARVLSTHEGGLEFLFISSMLSYVGLDPVKDVNWVFEPKYSKWKSLFVADKVDLVNAFAPFTYQLEETGVGHVLLDTTMDDPWRNFFCCMIGARGEFVRKYPIATKRALRALAKAQQFCAHDQENAAKKLVELGATKRLDHAKRALRELNYSAWRVYDPAATLRFFSLRLREVGMVKSSPTDIIKRGTDFRFLNELRAELKM